MNDTLYQILVVIPLGLCVYFLKKLVDKHEQYGTEIASSKTELKAHDIRITHAETDIKNIQQQIKN